MFEKKAYVISVIVIVDDNHPSAQGDEWEIVRDDIHDSLDSINRNTFNCVEVKRMPPIEVALSQ